jgi:hypothetical protein
MKRLLPVLVVLIVVVGLGVGIAMYVRRRHRQANRPWAANPCRDGLAFADNTIEPTLKISVLETSCENQTAGVHFSVTNLGTAQIKYFMVRAIYTYDHYVDDGAEVGTGPLAPGQSDDSYFGMGPPTLASRKPVGELRSITLITSQLEFADGRKWRRPSIHEPTPKAAAYLEFHLCPRNLPSTAQQKT